jgi:hypothetical protein
MKKDKTVLDRIFIALSRLSSLLEANAPEDVNGRAAEEARRNSALLAFGNKAKPQVAARLVCALLFLP